ncbi:hypothetical protein [Sphingomonas profundi]|uniref:hypothetical protein n=1 Tax=Alterirhizorhabdus profundi TaxID=2681549 RepID=UPI001E414C05|nr:hypothetical protein [Sphingomonas profundi]
MLLLDTLPNQTPDFTIAWIMRALADGLTDPLVRDELLGMTVGDLIAQPPRGDFWMRIDAATPPATANMLACGNSLVARRL